MKNRFILFQRSAVYYCEDTATGKSSFLNGGSGGSGNHVYSGSGWLRWGWGGGTDGGGGGGGYSGGGSVIDSSALKIFAEISGVSSPNDSPNGEIIITDWLTFVWQRVPLRSFFP